jgi:hypothetical protein
VQSRQLNRQQGAGNAARTRCVILEVADVGPHICVEEAGGIEEADVVLDCSDNFATRHAVNRACVAAGKPLVSGAAIRFDGQIAVFDPRDPKVDPIDWVERRPASSFGGCRGSCGTCGPDSSERHLPTRRRAATGEYMATATAAAPTRVAKSRRVMPSASLRLSATVPPRFPRKDTAGAGRLGYDFSGKETGMTNDRSRRQFFMTAAAAATAPD